MSVKYISFITRLILSALLLLLILHTFHKSTTNSGIHTLKQYTMISVNPITNQPQHILLFHDDHRALYKTMDIPSLKKKTHPKQRHHKRKRNTTNKSNWKLCTYKWQPRTNTLRYSVLNSDSDTDEHHQQINFQTIDTQPSSDTSKAFVAYSNDHQTTYLWKPTKNTFRCKSLQGKTIQIQSDANKKQNTPLPFDAIRVITDRRMQVQISSQGHKQWIDCGLTCRKTSGEDAVRKYDAVLYVKPILNKSRLQNLSPTFQNAIVRWSGARVVVQWKDMNGVRRVGVVEKEHQPHQSFYS